jgi:hypothetical protein
VSQFEQENDLGRGGGEVDEDTLEDAWDTAEEREGPVDEPAEED